MLSTTEKHLANIQPRGNEEKKFKRSFEHTSNGSHEGVENDKKQNKEGRASMAYSIDREVVL